MRAAKLLGLNGSSAQVRRSFDALLEEIRDAVNRYPESFRASALQHMIETSDLFAPKLFTCYDHPDIPPTDNALEGVFRDVRRHERLITGHKSTARRTVRDGPFLLPVLQRVRRGLPSVEDLGRVPEECWRARLRELQAARARYDHPRRVRQNIRDVLDDLVKHLRGLPDRPAP
jgi:hypothetical protein